MANIFNGINQTPTGVFSALSTVDDNLPKSFLTYVLFDKNMVPQAFDFDQVTTAAQIPLVAPETQQHERLHLDNIQIQKEGFIYIYVSNLSNQNMDVYFDDLKVSHQYSDIVAGGDYYPFGLEIGDRQITREEYRYKYQGKYAEKDDETGWNHFELREYDAVVGRWLVPDPAGQYYSPYVGMGNNPISRTDPDGGLDWVRNSEGEIYWDNNAISQATTKVGETYIGQSFSRLDGAGNFKSYNADASITDAIPLPEMVIRQNPNAQDNIDINKAVNWLNNNSGADYNDAMGECAKRVVDALIEGGAKYRVINTYAKDFGSTLFDMDFDPVNVSRGYIPVKGDVAVLQPWKKNTSGHMQMYNGKQWVSDYKQGDDFWPWAGSRDATDLPSSQIYRYHWFVSITSNR